MTTNPPTNLIRLLTLLLLVGAAPFHNARADKPQPHDPHTQQINVVCTVGMVGDLVRNVGRDRVQVTVLMGEGVDPHLYKASPGDVRALTRADIVFYNGLNLEGRMGDILAKLARRTPTIAATDTIPRALLHAPPAFAGHHDPHVWFDVSLFMHCVHRVRDALTDHDPDHRDEYTANADAYLARMRELHEYARTQLATVDPSRRILITAHDAFGYFGSAYGVEVRGIQGLSTESEAGVRDINELVKYIADRQVKAVFVETSVSERNIRALVEGCRAIGHNVIIGGQLYSDAMGPDGTTEGSYLGMVRHNVDTIVKALK